MHRRGRGEPACHQALKLPLPDRRLAPVLAKRAIDRPGAEARLERLEDFGAVVLDEPPPVGLVSS